MLIAAAFCRCSLLPLVAANHSPWADLRGQIKDNL
jgi:hypothetical protein